MSTDTITTITPDTALTDVVEAYLATWNEADPAARLALIERVWAEGARHVDPLADARGNAAIDEMISGLREQFPGHRIVRTTGIDSHNELFRFGWAAVAPDGAAVMAGTDVCIRAEDGRVQAIAGFIGDLPDL